MGAISTTLRMRDDVSGPMQGIISTVSSANAAFETLQDTIASTAAVNMAGLGGADAAPVPVWQPAAQAPVFQTGGLARYREEIAAANQAMTSLAQGQERISSAARSAGLFPENAVADLEALQSRMSGLQDSVIRLASQPIGAMGADVANRQMEALRARMLQVQQTQDSLNIAVRQMDISGANAEYQRLVGIAASLEREIRDSAAEQQRFNSTVQSGTGLMAGLWGQAKGMVAAYAGIQGAGMVLGLSDELTQTASRLGLMNDGMQTTAHLQEMVFQAAQRSRGAYLDTSAAVARLGILAKDAFSSSAETVAFAEQLNKQFVIGGASAQEQAAAMYQLTQAMAAGRLQGDEFRSIMENAPLLAQSIAKELEVSVGELREMSSQGVITADVIKSALFSAADETNARFEAMPKTFGQIWTSFQNEAIIAFQPVLARLNEIANSERFESFVSGTVDALQAVASIAADLFGLLVDAGAVVHDNWSWLGPVVLGAAIAFGIYKLSVLGAAAAHGIHTAALTLAVPVYSLLTGATMADTAAQWGLNAALYACPLTWIIMLVVALIAILFAAVGAVNHFAGTNVSATGLICGAFAASGAFIANIFIMIYNRAVDTIALVWNAIAAVANFLGNVFTDPIGATGRLFLDLADLGLAAMQKLASGSDILFGTDFSGAIQGWRDELTNFSRETFGAGVEIVPKMNAADFKLNRMEYGASFHAGYNMGQGPKDPTAALLDPLEGVLANAAAINGSTKSMADSMEFAEEDLKWMKDLAERDTVNRFTTAEIRVDLGGVTNHVSSDTDLDSMMDYLVGTVYDRMAVAAEQGGHI